MDSTTTFPNELWLQIFSHLSPCVLRNLSSTRRALYDIARPLGFTEFKLRPYPYDFQPPKAQLDDATERLRFYSSPKVAPYVQSCTARHTLNGRQDCTMDEGAPHVLVNAFFEYLPKFAAMQRIYMDRMQFTQIGITNLCGLPALTHVEFSGCKIAAGEQLNADSLNLRVATFITRFDHMCDLWMSLISRDSLRELSVSDILPLAKPDVQPFPKAHTLTVNDLPMRIWDTLTIFAKFPALRVFSTDYRGVYLYSPMQRRTARSPLRRHPSSPCSPPRPSLTPSNPSPSPGTSPSNTAAPTPHRGTTPRRPPLPPCPTSRTYAASWWQSALR
ncbi:hypothetical protein DFH09DRAFT_1170481 [Mycena vulgaris]|nr:hypothetical protein DFH09DRAFT_1170481 [Mycena vulgaris]